MKICVVTGTRAEYGLLYWLMKEIDGDPDLELQLVVTGMHLSPEFGLTFQEIELEFRIDKKVEILLSSDTPVGIAKSMGLAQIGFADVYEELKPDLVVVLGDRYEILAAVSAAMVARIPIAHLHGGETTEGAFDEAIRHSITKMSHLHFTATEEYRRRVIQLGESPSRTFNVGALGVESIRRMQLLGRSELEEELGFELGRKNLLITFHPVTLESDTAHGQFLEMLTAIDSLPNTKFIFTKANSDTGGRIINKMIDEYVNNNQDKAISFVSLGRLRYLSAMRYVDAVVGNSSSGIIEAPTLRVPTINIGDRQKGRIKATSVLDCAPSSTSIKSALACIYSHEFQRHLLHVRNPYGEGYVSKKIIDKIKAANFDSGLKKKFFDVEFNVEPKL